MKRRIEEIRKRLAEQRKPGRHNDTQHQWIAETTTVEQFWIKARVAKAVSKAAMI